MPINVGNIADPYPAYRDEDLVAIEQRVRAAVLGARLVRVNAGSTVRAADVPVALTAVSPEPPLPDRRKPRPWPANREPRRAQQRPGLPYRLAHHGRPALWALPAVRDGGYSGPLSIEYEGRNGNWSENGKKGTAPRRHGVCWENTQRTLRLVVEEAFA